LVTYPIMLTALHIFNKATSWSNFENVWFLQASQAIHAEIQTVYWRQGKSIISLCF